MKALDEGKTEKEAAEIENEVKSKFEREKKEEAERNFISKFYKTICRISGDD